MNDKNIADNLYTIAFYNVENLFDTHDDVDTLDDDFTPEGKKKWNAKRYSRKLKKMSSVLAQIGKKESGYVPAIIGLAEVENNSVINDLLKTSSLKDHNYGVAHFDSSDERGIEVALLYKKSVFDLLHAEPVSLFLTDEEGERDYTRDVLLVKGYLKGTLVYFLVNHWPSRRSGTDETEAKRVKAAELNLELIAKVKNETPDANIIVMGDFNDNPTNNSLKQYLVPGELYNPFESIFDKGAGTLTHNGEWHLFDQIMLSSNFLEEAGFRFDQAYIFDEHFLKEWKGKRKGSPFRTYIGKWHQGGYSDHFPVYITLAYHK